MNRHEDGWSFGELQSRAGAANWALWGELRPSVVSTSPKVHKYKYTNTKAKTTAGIYLVIRKLVCNLIQ